MKGEVMNEREVMALIDELMKKVEDLQTLLAEVTPFIVAYKYCLESFEGVLEDFEHESELLEQDLKSGESGFAISHKCFENRTKKKLISEVICFMTQAIDDAREGVKNE